MVLTPPVNSPGVIIRQELQSARAWIIFTPSLFQKVSIASRLQANPFENRLALAVPL